MSAMIEVHSVSKKYRLGVAASGQTLRDTIASLTRRSARPGADQEFWALRDVSFEVRRGEVLGIIGPNGAGKSTLLKILSRITEPTVGEIVLRGRVASLLEVGTGFHPELSGRENIFLNGVILGMKRAEVQAKLDEIVAFSEVEKFLETPVKRYSSGMYVRLAFAVAAHLDPDILIVDEVLAVGDLSFQKKCLAKMSDLAASGGRTILFVSHNIDAVRRLTHRCVVLERGRVTCDGTTSEAVNHYLQSISGKPREGSSLRDCQRPPWAGDRQLEMVDAKIETDGDGHLPEGRQMTFRIQLEPKVSVDHLFLEIKLHDADGSVLGTGFPVFEQPVAAGREVELAVTLQNPGLAPGRYFCTLVLLDPSRRVRDAVSGVLPFTVDLLANLPHQHLGWNKDWGTLHVPTLAANLQIADDA